MLVTGQTTVLPRSSVISWFSVEGLFNHAEDAVYPLVHHLFWTIQPSSSLDGTFSGAGVKHTDDGLSPRQDRWLVSCI